MRQYFMVVIVLNSLYMIILVTTAKKTAHDGTIVVMIAL